VSRDSSSTERAPAGRDALKRAAIRELAVLGAGTLAVLALVVWLLGWVADRSASGAAAGEAVDAAAKTITVAMSYEPPQLDSTQTTDGTSMFVLGHVMEGLLRYGAHEQLVPGIAERWEIEPDHAVFHLRAGARWSDGKPVTARDFVFAWRKVVDPATASQYAFIMYPVKNAEAINNGKLPVEDLGVRAIDETTLRVEFERPIAYFDKLVAAAAYLPIRRDFYESRNGRYGADADDLLYDGPFELTAWVHGAHLRLTKNPRYWNAKNVHLRAIDIPYITADADARMNLYKDGKIALADHLNAGAIDNTLAQGWPLHQFGDGFVFFTEFNERADRPTRDYHLRKAIQLVTDPSELVNKVMKVPGNIPGKSLFPLYLRGVRGRFRAEHPAPAWHVDVPGARAELAEARRDLGVERIRPLVLLCDDSPLAGAAAEYLQDVYKRTLGLDTKIDKQIFKQRLAKSRAGQFDLVISSWGPDYLDPMTFGNLFASWNPNNRGRYRNRKLDHWVEVAQSSLDPQTRMDAFGKIQRILLDDVVIIPMYERGVVYVQDPRLKGVVRRVLPPDPDYTHAYIDGGAPQS
jgi:oligopeptide transport system substrate-binding protein